MAVVSDGSSDRTAERARAAGAAVLELPCNLGVGPAVQTGLQWAFARGFGLVARLDARLDASRRARVASILDTFSCFVQGLIPYGAQLLMASGLAGVGAAAIIRYLYYPFALGLVALAAIFIPASFRSRK